MGKMFPEQPHINPERRFSYEDVVDRMKGLMLMEAYNTGDYLERHFEWFDRRCGFEAFGKTDFKIVFHEDAEVMKGEGRQCQLNSLPGPWTACLSPSLKELFKEPKVPIWDGDGVWNVLESFCWISERMGGCAARSLFETVKFPSLLIQHPRTKRTPIEWHAFLRQKAVHTWQRGRYAEWWEAVSLQEYKWLGGDRARDTTEVQMVFRNLERRMMSPSRLLYWDQVKEWEANCAYCTSDEYLQERAAKESDDAFNVEPEDSHSMDTVNDSIEQQLRQLLTPWPRRFALEQNALFLNLTDIQTEFSPRKHTKDKRGGIKHAERLLKQWISVKNDCFKIIDKVGTTGNTGHTWAVCNKFSDFPSLENEKEKIWTLISSLPGRVTPREVLERLEWCEEEESCHCSNHWGRMSGQIQLFLSLGFHNGMHPAVAFWEFMDRARYSRARGGGP